VEFYICTKDHFPRFFLPASLKKISFEKWLPQICAAKFSFGPTTQLEMKAENPLISAHSSLLALFSSMFSARSAFTAYF
jgi:hypothetical protein